MWLCKVAERQMLRPSFVPPPHIRALRDLTRYRVDLLAVRTAEKQRVVWLAKVAERQMIRPSFVPTAEIRRLRDLTRYRIDLVTTRAAEKNRVEKLLEDAQIKLSVVASDIFGASGRDMMAALVAGERDPKSLAALARRRLKAKIGALEEAFTGHFTDHHAFLLAKMLTRIDALAADIAELDARIEELLAPFAPAVARLDAIPGIGPTAAAVIIAEVGVDMTRFPTPAHLRSWALRPRSQGVGGEEEGHRQHRTRQPLSGPHPRRGRNRRRPHPDLPG